MKGNSSNSQDGNGSETSLVLAHSFPGNPASAPVPVLAERTDEPATNYLKIVHASLRGRYVLVGALSVVCAGLAALGAWNMNRAKPIFTSEGLVQIHYFTKMPINDTSASEPLSMFEQYMATQKAMITSRRVIDTAMEDPIWKKMGEEPPKNPRAYFTDSLQVEIKAKSELIHLTVSDSDPGMAAAAVTSVIDAYAKVFDEQEKKLGDEPMRVLDDHVKELRGQIASLNDLIDVKQKPYGTTKIDFLFEAAQLRFRKFQDAVSEVDLAMAGAERSPATKPAGGESTVAVLPVPEQIARVDGTMRNYLENRHQLEGKLAQYTSDGLGPNNSAVKALNAQIAAWNDVIDDYVTLWHATNSVSGQIAGDPNGGLSTLSPETLRAKRKELETLRDDAEKKMLALGSDRREFQRLEADLASRMTDEAKLSTRLEGLRDVTSMGSKLQIISTGEVPISPTLDRRPKFAVAAAGMGLMFPVGLAVLFYMLVRRYRYADETVADSVLANVPMLGLLPDVRSKRELPEVMRAMAHGVHHLRVLLSTRRNAKQAYLVTSAAEGEGKTSLAVALGMSFAATRRRTLLIDGDFVGQRLTRGFSMDPHEGMYEALADGNVTGRVRALEPNLDVLPAGKAGPAGAFGITNESIHQVLEAARKSYDTIIVDSGPILGSLEASMLAPEVDSVILTIARGQQQSLLESAMRRLHSLGAEIAGVVFNRAKLKDFHYSTYASTAVSAHAQPVVASTSEHVHVFDRFGPIVRAVAQAAPAAA